MPASMAGRRPWVSLRMPTITREGPFASCRPVSTSAGLARGLLTFPRAVLPSAPVPHPHRGGPQARPENRSPVRFLQALDVVYARLYHRVIVRAPCRLPLNGPAIVVCNHVNGLDPVLIQSVCKRRLITWMMAKEYFGNRLGDWIFETVGGVPVERNGKDMASTRKALRALHDGRVIGIFPEGRLPPGRELLPFQTGVAMLAARSGAPVYPVYITGTHRGQGMAEGFLRRNTAEV